ncbi:MAG: hypothetical protein HOP15_01400 [Planctomycetes bacterium]|nr:hypothetical protein [Planctomycetota bacterium]
MILLSAVVAAQKQTNNNQGSTAPPISTPGINLAVPKNKLVFPYGVQTFERKEYLKVGSDITAIPGWKVQSSPSMVTAVITESVTGIGRPGTNSSRWLDIDDLGAGGSQGFTTPPIQAPAPWNYSWKFSVLIGQVPASAVEVPTFAVQHLTNDGLQDAWGVRLTPSGAELFMSEVWGPAQSAPLWAYAGLTDIGQWVDVRIEASLQMDTLVAFVNGNQVAMLRTHTPAGTDVTNLGFAYHGGGLDNSGSMLFDDLGVAFGGPVCEESLSLTFENEDDAELLLVNGQRIDTEFGEKVTITAALGPNRGPAIFDSTDPGGPNSTSQDPDLLVDQGNVLILQNDAAANPDDPFIFPRPNDDEDGGTLEFAFIRPLRPLSIDLIDIDAAGNEALMLTLTDFSGETRTYSVPPDWTGNGGVETLDLTDISAQAPFNTAATGVDSSGLYDPNAVVSMDVVLGGSGALDNFEAIIPCIVLAFENEDDNTPVSSGTALANGQDISFPAEFGVEVTISDAGANAGAAIFTSTPGGPNALGPDKDLLVGLFNILILQNDLAPLQAPPGFFTVPNDDTQGGTLTFDFPGTVQCHQIDLIDVDEEESVGITVILEDLGGNLRTYDVPIAWTEDLLNDGPPGFRTLDLLSLAPQPGFASIATGFDTGLFDSDEVIKLTIELGGAQAVDNLCFCP